MSNQNFLNFLEDYDLFIANILKSPGTYIYISPNGSDITGNGDSSNPYHTPQKAYSMIGSTGADAEIRYIIAKEGVYDLDNITNTPGSALAFATDKVLFFGDEKFREKNIVVVSEKLHGCKIKGSIDLVLDTSYGVNGISSGIKRYKFKPEHLPFTTDLKKIDFSLYDYDYNLPHNVSLTSPSTLSPCLLNRGETGSEYPELYLSYPESFTFPSVNISGSKFVPYGSTTDGILHGITGAGTDQLMDLVFARDGSGISTDWTNTTLVMQGGNNNLSFHKVVGISYAERKINILDKPPYSPVRNIAFIGNKSWLGNTYEYAFELDGEEKYFYVRSDSTIAPRIPVLRFGINLCRVKNIQFIGFDIFEFREENVGYSSNADNFKISSNIVFKYNAFHHADNAAFHGNFSNSLVLGNLCYKSFYRGLHFSGCTGVNIKYNTVVGWRTKTGIYMSGSSGNNVYGNNIFTIATQHGNGMAFYDRCADINIEKNFIYTPTNIGVAIQEYNGISGNPGFTIKNNVLFSDRGLKIYEVEQRNCGMRGDLANFKILNNVGSVEIDKEETLTMPWWKFNNFAIRNNFLTGPLHVVKNLVKTELSTNHLLPTSSLSSGSSGSYILGTTAEFCGGSTPFIVNAPQEYIDDFYQSGLGYAIYNGKFSGSAWNHSWLPGITVGGVMIPDSKAIYRWWAYNKNLDGVTCLYNNIWLCKSTDSQISASISAVGLTSDFDYTDSATNSKLLLDKTFTNDTSIFSTGFYFQSANGSTLQTYLIDPTAENTGKYDFRVKPTIFDHKSDTVTTAGIGIDWVGPSFKGNSYAEFMTNNLYDWWLYNYDQIITEETANTTTQPTSNHPITISLTTTDIKKDISWASKDTFNATTHGADSFYSDIVQIPNYLEKIEDITDPANDPSIGPSRSNETSGNSVLIPNQGGVFVTGGTVDITLDTTIGAVNSIDVKNLATKFQSVVRTANGNTFAVILHGKTIPSTQFGEYKYVAPQSMPREEWENNGSPTNIDPEGLHYQNFYKEFAYIAFNSKESPVVSQITNNQISFRKSPHHTYISFTQPEMDGLSLSNGATGLSYFDLVTGTSAVLEKISKLQALPLGITCSINSYGESISANRSANVPITFPSIITCTNKTRKFVGLIGNDKIVLQGIAVSGTSSIFNSASPRYEHNGSIGSFNQAYQRNPVDQTTPHYTIPPTGIDIDGNILPPATIHLRFSNLIATGSKNLLAYKVVPNGGTRLFGASPNIGITAGSYVRISGSASNNGIYQVLATIDGIEGDTASNTKTGGSTEYQYLELSRAIVPEEQAVGKNIKIENVSHLPILHIKYRIPN